MTTHLLRDGAPAMPHVRGIGGATKQGRVDAVTTQTADTYCIASTNNPKSPSRVNCTGPLEVAAAHRKEASVGSDGCRSGAPKAVAQDDDLRALMACATPAERANRFVASVAALEGRTHWAGGSGPNNNDGYRISAMAKRKRGSSRIEQPNDFALWVRGEGPEPNPDAGMNCWEGLMLGAHRAGAVSLAWLRARHADAAEEGDLDEAAHSYFRKLRWIMQTGARTEPVTPERDLKPGELVYFDNLRHVALALGTRDAEGDHEVLSLWDKPERSDGLSDRLQRTTIAALCRAGGPFLTITSGWPVWVNQDCSGSE